METRSLFFITDESQKLPPFVILLIHAAMKGDSNAKKGIIDFFSPSIKRIAKSVQISSYNNYCDTKQIIDSGIMTVFYFIDRHDEEGFCKFIFSAIKENMKFTLATGNLP